MSDPKMTNLEKLNLITVSVPKSESPYLFDTNSQNEDMEAHAEYMKRLRSVKKEFYTKLLAKLEKIKSGEMSLDRYIENVKAKIEKL